MRGFPVAKGPVPNLLVSVTDVCVEGTFNLLLIVLCIA